MKAPVKTCITSPRAISRNNTRDYKIDFKVVIFSCKFCLSRRLLLQPWKISIPWVARAFLHALREGRASQNDRFYTRLPRQSRFIVRGRLFRLARSSRITIFIREWAIIYGMGSTQHNARRPKTSARAFSSRLLHPLGMRRRNWR